MVCIVKWITIPKQKQCTDTFCFDFSSVVLISDCNCWFSAFKFPLVFSREFILSLAISSSFCECCACFWYFWTQLFSSQISFRAYNFKEFSMLYIFSISKSYTCNVLSECSKRKFYSTQQKGTTKLNLVQKQWYQLWFCCTNIFLNLLCTHFLNWLQK